MYIWHKRDMISHDGLYEFTNRRQILTKSPQTGRRVYSRVVDEVRGVINITCDVIQASTAVGRDRLTRSLVRLSVSYLVTSDDAVHSVL